LTPLFPSSSNFFILSLHNSKTANGVITAAIDNNAARFPYPQADYYHLFLSFLPFFNYNKS